MSALLQLAERCEAATGPDRELDAEIAEAVVAKHGRETGWCNSENGDYYVIDECAASYTASLDAAMTLVPDGLDPQICKGPMFALAANAACPWGVSLIGPARDVDGEFGLEIDYDSFDANAATAPLAICAAALRARGETA